MFEQKKNYYSQSCKFIAIILLVILSVSTSQPAYALVRESTTDNSTIAFDSKIMTDPSDWQNFAFQEAQEGGIMFYLPLIGNNG